jgi:hypothetical protein
MPALQLERIEHPISHPERSRPRLRPGSEGPASFLCRCSQDENLTEGALLQNLGPQTFQPCSLPCSFLPDRPRPSHRLQARRPQLHRPGYQAPAAYKETGASAVTTLPPPSRRRQLAAGLALRRHAPRQVVGDLPGPATQPTGRAHCRQHNQTLRQALENYLAARDQVSAARSGLFPTLSVGAGAQREKIADNSHSASTTKSNTYNDFTLVGQASWEPDFWGRIRRTVEAAHATALRPAPRIWPRWT